MTPFTSAEIQRENLAQWLLGQRFPTFRDERAMRAHAEWLAMMAFDAIVQRGMTDLAARDRAACEAAHFGDEETG